MAKIRWRIEHDYREIKDGLGLDHFEGRSWTGWHRHATLVTAAQFFLTELRLAATLMTPATPTQKPTGRSQHLRHPPRTPVPDRDLARDLPPMPPASTNLTKHY
jgi:hypothetical protein